MQLIKVFILFLSLCFTQNYSNSYGDKHFLKILNSEKHWEVINTTEDSIIISIKHFDDYEINALKVQKKTNISLNKITETIYDIDNYDRLLTNSNTIKTQLINENQKFKIAHQLIEVNIPFFDNREYVFQINKGSFNPSIEKILCYWEILEYSNEFKDIFNNQNIVLNEGAGIWKYQPIDKNNNIIEYILFLNPGGFIPQIMIDMLNKNSMVTLFRDVMNYENPK